MVANKRKKAVKVNKTALRVNFDNLTLKQLQKRAQANHISIARTKKDLFRLLKPLEPDIGLESLEGAQLKELAQKHKISSFSSKVELIELLKQKISNNG